MVGYWTLTDEGAFIIKLNDGFDGRPRERKVYMEEEIMQLISDEIS